MTYQQCRYKDNVEKIPVRDINGQSYVLLKDVHDYFPDIRRFTCDGEPIPFEHNQYNRRLKLWCIRAFTGKVIDCHKPVFDDRAASKIADNSKQPILEQIRDKVDKT